MSTKSELAAKLQETSEIIQWAISLVPVERLLEPPPHGKHPQSAKGFKTYFGDWPALRQLFHLVYYEENFAIPAMQSFTSGSQPSSDLVFPGGGEEQAWQAALLAGIDCKDLSHRLRELRSSQVELLAEISDNVWVRESLETGMGRVSAEFVVAKTVQHSLEHANDIMKNALYWERALRWLDAQAAPDK